MLLSELLKNSSVYDQIVEDLDINIITKDSREVTDGALFCAIKGSKDNGELYIKDAVSKGALAVLAESDLADVTNILYLKSSNIRRDSSIIAKNFSHSAVDNLEVFAITGTNGKTSTVIILSHILRNLNIETSYLSTINTSIGLVDKSSDITTPDSLKLHNYFSEMIKEGSKVCVMEVSSHGIDQERVYGIKFDVKILTNITSDHLDYHYNLINYQNVKKKFLADQNAKVIVNLNDSIGFKLARDDDKVFTYAVNNNEADLCAFDLNHERGGTSFRLKFRDIERVVFLSDMNAYFMVENVLAAISGALVKGFCLDDILVSLKELKLPEGRFSKVDNICGLNIIIDYAHTKDALEVVLLEARKTVKKKLIVVFGCGGDRDSSKRKEMGRVAEVNSDEIYLTSDNSRSEKSLDIIQEIRSGISRDKDVLIIEDRREAIIKAVAGADIGDTIVIAGKGHEKFQDINGTKYHFSDFEVVDEALSIKGGLCGCDF